MASKTLDAPNLPVPEWPDDGGHNDDLLPASEGNGVEFPKHDPAKVEALSKMIPRGDIVIASALLDSDRGVYVADADALVELVGASRGAEGRALKRYLKVAATLQPKLTAAYQEYDAHRKRTARLVDRAVSNATSATV